MKQRNTLLITFIGIVLLFILTACGEPTSTASANPTLPVKATTVSVNGQTKEILTDSRGFALYYYLPDTKTTTACASSCATDWPPLLVTDNKVLNTTNLRGILTAQQTANGNQVEYNGHLLYTYNADTGPNQVHGDNVNSWFVATPDLS